RNPRPAHDISFFNQVDREIICKGKKNLDKVGSCGLIIWVSLPEIGAYREYFQESCVSAQAELRRIVRVDLYKMFHDHRQEQRRSRAGSP
ncbi:MAG: hypothetical protein WA430_09280, partial [Acidobacteriaceae bacterium]